MTSAQTTDAAVRQTILVNAPQAYAFAVFTERLGDWWPLQSYHIGGQPAQTAILEPRAGGRWFERAADGSECDWGRVLIWEPPHRLVISWDIGAERESGRRVASPFEWHNSSALFTWPSQNPSVTASWRLPGSPTRHRGRASSKAKLAGAGTY